MNNNNNNNNNDPPTRHQDSFTNGRSPLHYQRTPVSSWQQYPVSAEEQRDESLRNLSSARQPQTQTAWESRRSTSVPSPIRRGTGDATLSSFRQSPQRLPAALPRSTRKEVLLAPRASAEDEAAVRAELSEFERLHPIVETTVIFPPPCAGEDNEPTETTRAAHPRTESAQAELQLSPVIRTPASSRSTEGSPRQPISTTAAAAAAAAHSVTEERNYEEPVRRRSPADGEAAASAPMSIPIATNRFHVTDEDEGEGEEEGNEPTLPTTTATPNHRLNSVNAVSLPLQSRGEGSTARPPPILPPVKLPPARRHFCTIVLHFLQFESTSPLSLKDPKQFIAGLLDAAAATATDHHLPAQDAVSVKVRQHCFARLPITNDESASKNWEALLKEIELLLPFLVDVDAIVVQEITSASPSLTEHQQQGVVSGQSVDETPLNTARTSVDRWWSVVYKQPPPQSSFFNPAAAAPFHPPPAAGSNRPRISNNNNSPRRHLPSQQQQSVGVGTKIVISGDRRLQKDIVQVARDSLSSLRTMLFLFDESSMTFRYTVDLFDKQYQRYCEKLRDATKTPSNNRQVMGIMDVCGQVPCFDFLCPSSTGDETVTKAINRAGQQWMELEGLSQVFSSTHPTPLTKKEERGTATRVTSSNNAPANKVQNNNNNSNNRSSRGSTPRGRGRSPSLERSDSSSSAPSSSLSSKIQSFQALLRDQCPLLMKPDTNCPIRHYCSNNCDEESSTIRGHHQQHDDASTAADTKDQGSAWVRSHKALWTAVSSSSSSPCFPTVCTEITSSSLRPSANRNGGDGALTMAQMLTVVLRRGLRVC